MYSLQKIEEGRFEVEKSDFSMHEMLLTIVELMQHAAFHYGSSEIDLDVDPFLPACIVADQHRLRQVFINFLSNAIKFNSVGGRIRVRAFVEQRPENAWFFEKRSSAIRTVGSALQLASQDLTSMRSAGTEDGSHAVSGGRPSYNAQDSNMNMDYADPSYTPPPLVPYHSDSLGLGAYATEVDTIDEESHTPVAFTTVPRQRSRVATGGLEGRDEEQRSTGGSHAQLIVSDEQSGEYRIRCDLPVGDTGAVTANATSRLSQDDGDGDQEFIRDYSSAHGSVSPLCAPSQPASGSALRDDLTHPLVDRSRHRAGRSTASIRSQQLRSASNPRDECAHSAVGSSDKQGTHTQNGTWLPRTFEPEHESERAGQGRDWVAVDRHGALSEHAGGSARSAMNGAALVRAGGAGFEEPILYRKTFSRASEHQGAITTARSCRTGGLGKTASAQPFIPTDAATFLKGQRFWNTDDVPHGTDSGHMQQTLVGHIASHASLRPGAVSSGSHRTSGGRPSSPGRPLSQPRLGSANTTRTASHRGGIAQAACRSRQVVAGSNMPQSLMTRSTPQLVPRDNLAQAGEQPTGDGSTGSSGSHLVPSAGRIMPVLPRGPIKASTARDIRLRYPWPSAKSVVAPEVTNRPPPGPPRPSLCSRMARWMCPGRYGGSRVVLVRDSAASGSGDLHGQQATIGSPGGSNDSVQSPSQLDMRSGSGSGTPTRSRSRTGSSKHGAGTTPARSNTEGGWRRRKSARVAPETTRSERGFGGVGSGARSIGTALSRMVRKSDSGLNVRTASRDLWIRVEVQDEGVGISDVDKGRLFEPYVQVCKVPLLNDVCSVHMWLATLLHQLRCLLYPMVSFHSPLPPVDRSKQDRCRRPEALDSGSASAKRSSSCTAVPLALRTPR